MESDSNALPGYPVLQRSLYTQRAQRRHAEWAKAQPDAEQEARFAELATWAVSGSQLAWMPATSANLAATARWLAEHGGGRWIPLGSPAGLGQERDALDALCHALSTANMGVWRAGLPPRLWHEIRRALWHDFEEGSQRVLCLAQVASTLGWDPMDHLSDLELGEGNLLLVLSPRSPTSGHWQHLGLGGQPAPSPAPPRPARHRWEQVAALLAQCGEPLPASEIAELLGADEVTDEWLAQHAPHWVEHEDRASEPSGWTAALPAALEVRLDPSRWEQLAQRAQAVVQEPSAWSRVSPGWLRSFVGWLDAAQAPEAAYRALLRYEWLERWLLEPGGAHGALCNLDRTRRVLAADIDAGLTAGDLRPELLAALFACAMVSSAIVECLPEWAATWNHHGGCALTTWLSTLATGCQTLPADPTQPLGPEPRPDFSQVAEVPAILRLLEAEPPPTIMSDRWRAWLLAHLAMVDPDAAVRQLDLLGDDDSFSPAAVLAIRLAVAGALPVERRAKLTAALIQELDDVPGALWVLLRRHPQACLDLFGLDRIGGWIDQGDADDQLWTLAELVPLLDEPQAARFVETATRAFRASNTAHRENQRKAIIILPFAAPRQAFVFLTELLFAQVETELELWYANLPPLLAAAERIAPGTTQKLPPVLHRLVRAQE